MVLYSLTSPSDTFTVDGVGCYIVFTSLTILLWMVLVVICTNSPSDTFMDGVGCYIVFTN